MQLTREVETRAVQDLLHRACSQPAGLIVEGEVGIGKTTLWREATECAARQGFAVFAAQGAPAEVTYAYAVVADLLKDAVDDELLAGLTAVQRVALDRALHGGGEGPATDERIVAAAFLAIIEHTGSRAPILVAIDDAQWLDASSRAVIGYAVRRLTGRTGLLVTVRTGESVIVDALEGLRLSRPDALSRVSMRPLMLGEVHALISARLGRTLPRPVITKICEISGGNPLFALELARAVPADTARIADALPRTLAAIVRRRVGVQDETTAALLLATACAAAPTVESIGAATDMSTTRVVELLESMEDQRIVTLDGNRVRFTHPLFATGVYTNAASSHRRAMHRTLATLAERPEVRARHLALAATTADVDALSALDAAAEATVAQGAPAVAAELVELAVKLGGDSAARRIRAGELHFRAGSLVAARTHLQKALNDAPHGVLRCLSLMWLGAVKAYDDDMVGAVEAMSEAVDEAGDDAALGLLCLLRLALALAMTDRLGEALKRGEKAVELADRLGVPNLRSQALSIWVVGKFVAGQGFDHQALHMALQLEDPLGGATTFLQASAVQAMIAAYTGDLDRARVQMRAVQQRMLEGGTEVDIIWAAVHTAAIAVWSGRYAETSQLAQEAVQHAEQMGGRLVLVTAWTQQAAAAAYTGREADARAAAKGAIDTANAIGASQLAKEPSNSLAFLEVSLGNFPAALATLQPQLEVFDGTGGTEIEGGGHLPDAVEALATLGRSDEAEPLVEALERNGVRHDRPWMLAMGARGRGHILAARRDLDGAQRAVEEAMVHHQRLPMPFETARSQLLLGQLERRRRRKQDAAASLREALDTFERLGAPLWASRARAELTRLDSPRGNGHGLTAAEQRIAALAAAGLSNKQIAAELFIAAKTVEMNLSRVYRKLSVRSRAGLSTALRSDDVQGNP